MKKIISILFLFLLLPACYIIYNLTENKGLEAISVGDNIAYNPYLKNNEKVSSYNIEFINSDMRIIDLLNIINYNEEIKSDDKLLSIHQLLKKADILIISIGINDITYKINSNIYEIYSYINNLINNYDIILEKISKYDYKKVYVVGYFNINNNKNDVYTYANYKLKKITKEHNYVFLDINNQIRSKPEYIKRKYPIELTNEGYYQIYKLIVENLEKS